MRQFTTLIFSAAVLAAPAFAQLFIADSQNNRIRAVSTAGTITTAAGNGTGSFGGDGGAATSAEVHTPYGVATDLSGNLYIADQLNNRVRKVTAGGIISTVAGNGTPGFGGDGGPATSAALWNPTGVAVDALGNLYIADERNERIRKVDTTGTITTVAGSGGAGFGGDGGPATSALLYYPTSVTVDNLSNLYIADSKNQRVRMVSGGVISTVAGNGTTYKNFACSFTGTAGAVGLNTPTGVGVDALGNLYIADTANQCIRKVTSGNVSTVAGNGTASYSGDGGPATSAAINYPTGVVVDPSMNLYIADFGNNRIRLVNISGVISTYAGKGTAGFSGDGGPAGSAQLYNPSGVAVSQSIPVGSCQGTSSLSTLVSVSGTNVSAYVPLGSWSNGTTGVAVVNVEGSSVLPTTNPIPTGSAVNSCASNSVTGTTVCTANDNHVYVIPGGTPTPTVTTLTSAGTGTTGFSGGTCTNCGVAMDAIHNRAVVAMETAGGPGFQFLDLSTPTPTFGTAFASPSGNISEDPLLDPVHNELISATEGGIYEVIDTSTITSPTLLPTKFYENNTGLGFLDSTSEDCATRLTFAPQESFPAAGSLIYLADLSQAIFTPGTPGTWVAPFATPNLTGSTSATLGGVPGGSAVAQGNHIGVVAPEFGGSGLTAFQMPSTSGTGNPAVGAWETCQVNGFAAGFDPHTLAAYRSPNSGDGIAVLLNDTATVLARVDLTMMLTLPSATTTHVCTTAEATTFNSTMVTIITVP